MPTIIDESIESLRGLYNSREARLTQPERAAILEAIAWGTVIRNQLRMAERVSEGDERT